MYNIYFPSTSPIRDYIAYTILDSHVSQTIPCIASPCISSRKYNKSSHTTYKYMYICTHTNHLHIHDATRISINFRMLIYNISQPYHATNYKTMISLPNYHSYINQATENQMSQVYCIFSSRRCWIKMGHVGIV